MHVGSGQLDLSCFLARISTPLRTSVLGTPSQALVHEKEVEVPSERRSIRFAELHPKGANMEQLAKEAVARRLGSLLEVATLSERRRQEYFALLGPGPISDNAAAAIDDLVLSVKKSKNKKTTGTGMERMIPPEVA